MFKDFLSEANKAGVTYPGGKYTLDPNTMQILPPDPNYNAEDHSYIWNLGTMDPNTSGWVELTVTVNQNAVAGMTLDNLDEMYLNDEVIDWADESTLV